MFRNDGLWALLGWSPLEFPGKAGTGIPPSGVLVVASENMALSSMGLGKSLPVSNWCLM